MSDGNILHERCTPISASNMRKDLSKADSSNKPGRGGNILCESTPDIPTGEIDLAYSRYLTKLWLSYLFGYLEVLCSVNELHTVLH